MFAEASVSGWPILLLIYRGNINYNQQTTLHIKTSRTCIGRNTADFNSFDPYVSCDDKSNIWVLLHLDSLPFNTP